MFLGKKPTDAGKPNTDKPNTDKPSVDKPSVDKPNADKPVVDNNKPVDKVDRPVVNDKDSKVDVNKVKIESNRPTVANRNSDAPKTSDNSNIALYSMLLIGSIGAISVIFRKKLRTNK